MSRHGRAGELACCYARLESPEIKSSALPFLSFAGYSDGKRSTNVMSFVEKDETTDYTNLFTPVLHAFFTLSLALFPVEEE